MSIADLNAKITRSSKNDFETLQSISLYAHDPAEVGRQTLKALEVDASGNLKVASASAPLPSGASTEAKQDDIITELQTANTNLAKESTQASILADTSSLDTKIVSCNTNSVAVSSSALPAGGSTEAKQDDMVSLLEGQPPAGNRTKAIPVQLMVGPSGSQHSALRGVGGDLSVYIDDMNSDVAVNSGLSTSANQTTANNHLSTIAGDTTSLDTKIVSCNTNSVVVNSGSITETNSASILADTSSLDTKITSGSDSSLANAVQVLVYGAGNGSLHPFKVTPSGVLKTEEVVTWNTTEIFNAQINFGQNATSSTFDLGTDIHVPDDVMFFVSNSAQVDSEFAIEVSHNGTNWFQVNFLQANPQSNTDTMLSLINDFECAVVRYLRINISNGSPDTNSTYVINASTYNG